MILNGSETLILSQRILESQRGGRGGGLRIMEGLAELCEHGRRTLRPAVSAGGFFAGVFFAISVYRPLLEHGLMTRHLLLALAFQKLQAP